MKENLTNLTYTRVRLIKLGLYNEEFLLLLLWRGWQAAIYGQLIQKTGAPKGACFVWCALARLN